MKQMPSPIVVKDLSFFYNKKSVILKSLNTQFQPGTITAIVGMNGSGKTTLLNILSGIIPPKSGKIHYNEHILTGKNLITYKKELGFMPESMTLYPEETVYNVLDFLAKLKELSHAKGRIDEIIDKTGLANYTNRKISALSKGLKQRVNFAQALLTSPHVAIFDEPSNGFDYLGVRMFYDTLDVLKSNGSIIILTSHIFEELVNKVDKILFLQEGKIAREIDFQQNKIMNKEGTLIFVKLTFDKNIEPQDIIQFNTMSLKQDETNPNMLYGNIMDITLLVLLKFIHTSAYVLTGIRVNQASLETTIQ